jgi:hypothetical protein
LALEISVGEARGLHPRRFFMLVCNLQQRRLILFVAHYPQSLREVSLGSS